MAEGKGHHEVRQENEAADSARWKRRRVNVSGKSERRQDQQKIGARSRSAETVKGSERISTEKTAGTEQGQDARRTC
jgi:hypothetical protein